MADREISDKATLAKVYDPKQVEGDVYARWDANGAFAAKPDHRGRDRRFVVMMPLPNVTGKLHLGHAINNTLQDVITRWHRMRGFNSLYQPGTDHAGIATQAVVERRIMEEENKSRHDLGRDELVRRIWDWKNQYEARILDQLKSMGCSCDWSRVRFTLDDRYNVSVLESFFRWFRDGLIYRGERLVNWDTHLQTAVADDEVYHETVRGHFWHFKYAIKDPPNGGPAHLGFATTRPETMLGDTALAVNPGDQRYRTLIGRTALVPLFDPPREIPIIADEWADPEKGTGCVKITPAHDPNDYAVGIRHSLPMINVLTPEGRVNEAGGRFCGMVFNAEARNAVVAEMEQRGLLSKVEDVDVDLPLSDRSKSPIEPYLSPQWFVKMSDVEGGITLANGAKVPGLAQAAMDAVEDGRVRIIPERYKKTYLDWLGEKRDWCISRQLFWGHRIPVWSWEGTALECTMTQAWIDDLCGNSHVAVRIYRLAEPVCEIEANQWQNTIKQAIDEKYQINVALRCGGGEPAIVNTLESAGMRRDPDVLDTWFSSQLWPFATIGWPEQTNDLDYYYPGTVLITSRDIITLWVARMVLSGLYNLGDVPFRDVYIHPKILDGRGETMSKSKGNGVDPMDIIDAYGADAMRYALADMTTETQDVRMPIEYRCPHCEALTPQTAQNMQAKTIKCKGCKKLFATHWAGEEIQEQHGLAGMVSDKFEIGRNFCNKLWNAARFAFMNVEGVGCAMFDVRTLPLEDRWILARLSETCRTLHGELSRYRFSASIRLLRDFFWDSLCDWYIELTKMRVREGGPSGEAAKQVLAFCLDQTLRALHPFIPFITECLWEELNRAAPRRGFPGAAELKPSALLIDALYPPGEGWPALDDADTLICFASLQDVTRGVRDLRMRNQVPPKEMVTVTVNAPADRVGWLREQSSIIQRLANVGQMAISTDAPRPANSGTTVLGNIQIHVHGISDDLAERARLSREITATEKQIVGKEAKLANPNFLERAAPDVVTAERERLLALCEQRSNLVASMALLDT